MDSQRIPQPGKPRTAWWPLIFTVFIGLVLGLPLSVGAGRLISAQLYGISSWDPLALTMAALALAACSSCAAIIPAFRAASISPVSALRIE